MKPRDRPFAEASRRSRGYSIRSSEKAWADSRGARIVLFPHSVVDARKPDEHFAAEAEATRELGLDVAYIHHDALVAGRSATRMLDGEGDAVYRGWMVHPTAYERFDSALRDQDVRLMNDPVSLRRGHHFSGWYESFRGYTPDSY